MDPPRRSPPKRPTREIPPLPSTDVQEQNISTPQAATLLDSSPTSTPHEQPKHDNVHDPSQVSADDSNDLTPIRAHYLKKSLIQLQFRQELDALTSSMPNNVSALSYLGPPFTPPPKNGPTVELPLLRYVFKQFVLTFPFLAEAPKNFFPEKLQPFVVSMLSRNLSPGNILEDDSEGAAQATRLKLLNKVERSLSILLVSAVKLVEPERVVRLNQADLNRLEILAQKRLAREKRLRDSFEVNIVCVRTVVEKGRVRTRAHDEFIIRTRRRGQQDIFVSRRYGDFKTLADELRKAHLDEVLRPPPAKDRTYVAAPPSPGSETSAPYMAQSPMSPLDYNHGLQGDNFETPASPSNVSFSIGRLAREKNRLTLRSYLHSLLASSTIASSPVLRSFLTSEPTSLSLNELEDAKKREEADRTREAGRKKFAKEIAVRVEGLREAVKSVKGDMMGKDGLTNVFGTIKVTPDIRQLPSNYQAVVEWARISLASTVFHHFVASDDSSENFAALKRIHGMMPYFMLKAILKISNPIGMIRGVLDLFLAQPFGGRSLLQRMFTSSLAEEVKALEEDIEAVKDKVDDPMICEKVRLFINAPPEIQAFYKEEAAVEEMDLLAIILRSSEHPILSRPQMFRVAKSYRAHQEYLKQRRNNADSDDDDGPQDEDAWLFEDLALLAKLYSRLRDREQLIALIFEGVTAELLKDMITIFYAPLAQVYKAASISDSFGDLQTFVNDLIRTVEQTEELSQEDPHRAVQTFIDLIQRHEQMFYNFVHKVHSRGDGLFDNLMKWIELIFTVMRDGLGEPVSLEFLLPHTGRERQELLKEIDELATYHYKLKLSHENKVRRRFGQTQGQNDADAEDQATADLLQGVVQGLSFGELVQGDADDFGSEASSSEDDSTSSSECDSEDESEDSDVETSEDDVLQPPAPPPRARATTLGRSQIAGKSVQKRPSVPSLASPARRGLSVSTKVGGPAPPRQVKPSRSLNFHTGRTRPVSPPPVPPPPIPQKYLKQLQSQNPVPPPSPLPSSSNGASFVEPPNNGLTHNKLLSPGKRKNVVEQLKPPELHHIPQLLPVFMAMLVPGLRPR